MSGAMDTALDTAIMTAATAGRELKVETKEPKDERMVLCAIGGFRQKEEKGLLTVDAGYRPEGRRVNGYIVVGPTASRCNKGITAAELKQLIKVRRWVLNYVPINERMQITGKPSIVITKLVRLTCKTCGHVSHGWKDYKVDRKLARGELICENQIPVAGAEGAPATYKTCGSHDFVVDYRRTEMYNPNNDPLVDGVFAVGDTAILDAMMEKIVEGSPVRAKTQVSLPKVWCVYNKDQAPAVDWTPSTPHDKRMVKRAELVERTDRVTNTKVPNPLSLIPFGVARPHSAPATGVTNLRAVWLDVPEVDVGWACVQDLLENPDQDYKRSLFQFDERRPIYRDPVPQI